MQARTLKRVLLVIWLSTGPVSAAPEESASLAALRAAAEQGQADAQYELGILYEFGYNFPNSAVDAYVWYGRAADQGNAAAAARRDLLKVRLSAEELERAQTRGHTPASSSSR